LSTFPNDSLFFVGKVMSYKLKQLLIALFVQFFGLSEVQAASADLPLTILFSEELNEKGEQVPIPVETQKVFTYIEKIWVITSFSSSTHGPEH